MFALISHSLASYGANTASADGDRQRLDMLLNLLDDIQEIGYEDRTAIFLFDEKVKEEIRKVRKSHNLGMIRVDMIPSYDSEIADKAVILVDYNEHAVFYKFHNVVVRAPTDEAERFLRAGPPTLLNVEDLGSVQFVDVEEYEGMQLEVYELRNGRRNTEQWKRVAIDPHSGMIYRIQTHAENYLKESRYVNVQICDEMTVEDLRTGFEGIEDVDIAVKGFSELLFHELESTNE